MMPTGWSCGSRTIEEMSDLYLGTTAVRVFFRPGEGLPASAWSDPNRVGRQRLSALPAGCTAIVSHKDQNVDAAAFVEAWLKYRPDVLLDLVAHHEPEQQEGGDPTPTQFRASWTRQRQQVGSHPARADGRLKLAVCYTLQWIRAGGNWRTWYPDHEADAVDLILFDWYQYEPGAPNPYRPRSYEEPASALAKMLEISAAVGKDWGIAEVDHLRITTANGFAVDLDPTGEACAAWYRRFFAAAKVAGCRVWCHFHALHGDLTSRLPEQQALRELIEQEAADVGAQRRLNWINDGSPFRLMTPLAQLRDRLRGYGYTVYDIGNRSHLEHDPPEDHTPYSATGYPGSADYGIGYAIDIMPPPGSGLPSLQQLGAQLLADRKAGEAGARWLKYMNWEPEGEYTGACYHESWQPNYDRRSSSDRGHIHLSGLTGYESSTIAAGYDPVARIRGDDDMPTADEIATAVLGRTYRDYNLITNGQPTPRPVSAILMDARTDAAKARSQGDAVLSGLKALGEMVARESSSPDEVRALLAELPQPAPVDVDQLAGSVAERVLAGLPTTTGPVTREDLEAALRSALGSLDDTPQS